MLGQCRHSSTKFHITVIIGAKLVNIASNTLLNIVSPVIKLLGHIKLTIVAHLNIY